jgi:hypothetical protein
MVNPVAHPGSHTNSDFYTVRASPAPWAFGVLILPLGMYIGFIWTALPFLLSKTGVPVEGISRIAAILQIPPLLMFLWTPVVDVKLRRRTWLVLAAVSSSICVFLACLLIGPSHFNLLTALLFLGGDLLAWRNFQFASRTARSRFRSGLLHARSLRRSAIKSNAPAQRRNPRTTVCAKPRSPRSVTGEILR